MADVRLPDPSNRRVGATSPFKRTGMFANGDTMIRFLVAASLGLGTAATAQTPAPGDDQRQRCLLGADDAAVPEPNAERQLASERAVQQRAQNVSRLAPRRARIAHDNLPTYPLPRRSRYVPIDLSARPRGLPRVTIILGEVSARTLVTLPRRTARTRANSATRRRQRHSGRPPTDSSARGRPSTSRAQDGHASTVGPRGLRGVRERRGRIHGPTSRQLSDLSHDRR